MIPTTSGVVIPGNIFSFDKYSRIGIDVYDSGPFAPAYEGWEHNIAWTNGSYPIRIKGAWVTILADIHCVMDCWARLERKIDNTPVIAVTWDQYGKYRCPTIYKACDHTIPQQGRFDFHFMAKPIGRYVGKNIDYGVKNFAVHFAAGFDLVRIYQ